MLPNQLTAPSKSLQGSGSAQGSTPGLQPVRPAQGLQPQSGTPDSSLVDNSQLLFQAGSRPLKVEVARGQSSGLSTAPVAAVNQTNPASSSGGIFLALALIFGVLTAVTIIYYRRQQLVR